MQQQEGLPGGNVLFCYCHFQIYASGPLTQQSVKVKVVDTFQNCNSKYLGADIAVAKEESNLRKHCQVSHQVSQNSKIRCKLLSVSTENRLQLVNCVPMANRKSTVVLPIRQLAAAARTINHLVDVNDKCRSAARVVQ